MFVSSDLSQIEPRIIAHILFTQFGDNGMRQLYLDGRDLYTEMAMFTFGFEREYCVDGAYSPDGTFKPRKLMKEGVLAFLYGQSAKAFGSRMGVSPDVAAAFFAGMIAAYPGLTPFRESVIRDLDRRGSVAYAETLFGRKRRFSDYRRNKAELAALDAKNRWKRTDAENTRRNKLWGMCAGDERRAINAIIQGTAADILKQNMVRVDQLCLDNGYKFHCSIHDELAISVPLVNLTPELVQTVTDIMTQTVELSVPLGSDTVICPRWAQEYKPDEWDFTLQRPKMTETEATPHASSI